MKNTFLWIGGAVIIVLAILFASRMPSESTDLAENNETNGIFSEETGTTGTNTGTNKPAVKTTPKVAELTSIFPQKGSFECIYEEVTPSKRTTNVIYFSDGKMRGEFRVLSGVSNIMLYDGRNLYTWVEGQNSGSISVPKSIADFPPIIPKDITSGKVLGAGLNNVSWDCHSWIKNASLLVKPSYVSFK